MFVDDKPESSTLSDPGSGSRPAHSDEDVILASSRPKKRAGRRVFKETRHPIYRGVRRRNKNKWVCELREPNKKTRIWLGTYPTPEMAARAHDVAALALRGKSACLNFADSAWRLPQPASMDAKDIRRAAAEAAEAFRPLELEEEAAGGGGVRDVLERVKISDQRDVGKGKEVESGDQKDSFLEENVFFMDEEAVFDMPGLLTNMAEGLLLSPPPLIDSGKTNTEESESSDVDLPLWSYSI